MRVVDTNILVHGVNRASPKHEPAAAALVELGRGTSPWALTWTGIYEFLRVVTHPRVLPRPLTTAAARDFVDVLTDTAASRILTETEAHERLLAICLAESPRVTGNAVHDLHTAVLMREHGIDEILTEDRDFLAFPWVRVVPL